MKELSLAEKLFMTAPKEEKDIFRSNPTEVFLREGALKICSKFTGEHPRRSVIAIKLQATFRGGSRAAATSKMERFVMIVKDWKPLTIITKRSILDAAAVLDPSLTLLKFLFGMDVLL